MVNKFCDLGAKAWKEVGENGKKVIELVAHSKKASQCWHVPAKVPSTINQGEIPVMNQMVQETVPGCAKWPM